MLRQLSEFSALPNAHPALVHFPLACLPLALLIDTTGMLLRRQAWLAPAATTLYSVGAVSAWLALWAGERAANGLVGVPAAAQPGIGEHSDWAHYALYALIAVAVGRLVIELRPQLKQHYGARLGGLLAGLLALGVLVKAADLGGALVYEYGLGVRHYEAADAELQAASTPTAGVAPGVESALDRLVGGDDGSLVWRPAPTDQDAIGKVLVAAPGSDLTTVHVQEPGGEGLRLSVDRPTTLLLPGTFGDVHVEAEIELLDYSGAVGVVHHYSDFGDRGLFEISTEGEVVLDDLRQGQHTLLERRSAGLPASRFVLAVSSSGRHIKGLIDGKTVAHGHLAPGPTGSCGLRLEGVGTVRVIRMAVQVLRIDA